MEGIGRNIEKTTEELLNELETAENLDGFFEENQDELLKMGLSEYLNLLLKKYGLDKKAVFSRARMNDSNYGYEIFKNDRKHPSRDKLIRLCIGFPLTVDETEKALVIAKLRPLYPRDMRDACILFALHRGYDVDQVNDLLFEKGEKTLE